MRAQAEGRTMTLLIGNTAADSLGRRAVDEDWFSERFDCEIISNFRVTAAGTVSRAIKFERKLRRKKSFRNVSLLVFNYFV